VSRREVTGKRPLEYSKFHREHLPRWCYMTDIDAVEWREGRGIVALIETADIRSKCDRDWQLRVLKELSRRSGIPAYFVRHDRECTIFVVERLDGPGYWVMNREEYKRFLREL